MLHTTQSSFLCQTYENKIPANYVKGEASLISEVDNGGWIMTIMVTVGLILINGYCTLFNGSLHKVCTVRQGVMKEISGIIPD